MNSSGIHSLKPDMILMMSKFNFFFVVYALLMLLTSTAAHANDNGDAATVRLLVFGDSLVAGYGLPQGEDFPTRLDAALKAGGTTLRRSMAGFQGIHRQAASAVLTGPLPTIPMRCWLSSAVRCPAWPCRRKPWRQSRHHSDGHSVAWHEGHAGRDEGAGQSGPVIWCRF